MHNKLTFSAEFQKETEKRLDLIKVLGLVGAESPSHLISFKL